MDIKLDILKATTIVASLTWLSADWISPVSPPEPLTVTEALLWELFPSPEQKKIEYWGILFAPFQTPPSASAGGGGEGAPPVASSRWGGAGSGVEALWDPEKQVSWKNSQIHVQENKKKKKPEAVERPSSFLQTGQVPCSSSQGTMQPEWKQWSHSSFFTSSPSVKSWQRRSRNFCS